MARMVRVALPVLAAAIVVLLGLAPIPFGDTTRVLQAATTTDWPQVQKDAQRTGHSNETLGANFNVAWTRAFQPERVAPQVQAIVYGGTVFVGTESGNMYALDARTGAQKWVFKAGGPILNSAAADNGMVYFGAMDGAAYGLDASSGSQVWKQQLSGRLGFSTAPTMADGLIMLGGRNGSFYGLNPNTGAVAWSYNAGAPILQTAAADGGKVFFGAMDMSMYALSTTNGSLAWKTPRLAGSALKDYWPVAYQGNLFVRPNGGVAGAGISPGFPFEWFDDPTWISQYGPAIAAGNLTQVADAMNAQNAVMASYQANPSNFSKSLFILGESSGQEAMVVPHQSTQTMHGASTPPTVDRDGKLVIPTMFLRSGWGRLDLTQQRIVDILYDGYGTNGQPYSQGDYPAGMGNRDENLNVSTSANLVLAFHTEESNANYTGAFNLATRRWTPIGQGWRSGQMLTHALEGGGGNPASVSNGMVYHISGHELIARSTQ